MLVLVTYDVKTTTAEGRRRLQKVEKICQNYGQHVQNSVFECIVDKTQFAKLKRELKEVVHVKEDSLRIYQLGNYYKNKVEHVGTKAVLDLEGQPIF